MRCETKFQIAKNGGRKFKDLKIFFGVPVEKARDVTIYQNNDVISFVLVGALVYYIYKQEKTSVEKTSEEKTSEEKNSEENISEKRAPEEKTSEEKTEKRAT